LNRGYLSDVDPAFGQAKFAFRDRNVLDTLLDDVKNLTEAFNMIRWWFGAASRRYRDDDVEEEDEKDVERCLMEDVAELNKGYQSGDKFKSHWTQTALRVTHAGKAQSLTNPTLHFATLLDDNLLPLLNYRRRVLLKSHRLRLQDIQQLRIIHEDEKSQDCLSFANPLLGLTQEALVAYALRDSLTMTGSLAVTPHFATILDAYIGPTIDRTGAVVGLPLRLYIVTECGDESLHDVFFEKMPAEDPYYPSLQMAHRSALLFQTMT
jgi:hypothetical protein